MTTKTKSIRLDEKTWESLDMRCQEAGCNRNEYIKNIIQRDLQEKLEPKKESKPVKGFIVKKILDDGREIRLGPIDESLPKPTLTWLD